MIGLTTAATSLTSRAVTYNCGQRKILNTVSHRMKIVLCFGYDDVDNSMISDDESTPSSRVTEQLLLESQTTSEPRHSALTGLELVTPANMTDSGPDYVEYCPSNVVCERLGARCIECSLNATCRYGSNVSVTCHPKPLVICKVHISSISVFYYYVLYVYKTFCPSLTSVIKDRQL